MLGFFLSGHIWEVKRTVTGQSAQVIFTSTWQPGAIGGHHGPLPNAVFAAKSRMAGRGMASDGLDLAARACEDSGILGILVGILRNSVLSFLSFALALAGWICIYFSCSV